MKKTLAKVMALALAAVMVLGFAACGNTTPASDNTTTTTTTAASTGVKIGISMPTKALQRWNQDGGNMQTAFQQAGYTVDLEYADSSTSTGGDSATQINQLENMIASNCNVLVIAAVDGSSLTEVLGTAKTAGITVIAYDRLIMGTDAVNYYATFDNTKVGQLQGQYIVDTLKLADDSVTGPFNIEFFTGDPADNNINFFYPGAMSVLQPYLDSGKLVCKSGQTDISVVATKNWDAANSQSRMEDLISSQNYGPDKTKLDAVMCSNDSTAQGVTTALIGAGFDKSNFPIITGQDCDIVSMKNMLAGEQAMSVFKDTRTLADQVVTMVTAIVNKTTVPVNDTTTYNNASSGQADNFIPSFLCDPVQCTLDNYQALLIDTGYYTADQLTS